MTPPSFLLPDLDATHAIGRRIGAAARDGDVFAAVGDLGAGKTSLAQGIARGVGVPDEAYVNSPTFAILQSHPGPLTFHHIDLYRLGDEDEMLGLGLDDIVGVEGVSYVEWPRRAPSLFAPTTIWLGLVTEGAGRRLIIGGTGAGFARICAALSDERPPG
ncbi:MAG: tRNA threonylcarbamoyladenosine biosynthesis protein TsaE [Bradymonadia bacterium]|jgi:tRNA threonylcarbamoyladenosine biosynthesis protein TsaE